MFLIFSTFRYLEGCSAFSTILKQVNIVFEILVDTPSGGSSSSRKDQLVGISSFQVYGRENKMIGRIPGTLGNQTTRGFPFGISLLGRERFSSDRDTHKQEMALPNLE